MQENFTVEESWRWGEQILSSANISNCRMESFWLLQHALQQVLKNSQDIYACMQQRLTSSQSQHYSENILERARSQPLAYLLGTQEFFGLKFNVTPDVLIPRPETEILVRQVLLKTDASQKISILEFGTGSGNIAGSLAHHLPQTQITAVDISSAALAVAQQNAINLNVQNQITFICADLFKFSTSSQKFDRVVCNPPYIASGEIAKLATDVQREPHLALDGGTDGLKFLFQIIRRSKSDLKDNGWIFLEIGYDQSDAVLSELLKENFIHAAAFPDDQKKSLCQVFRQGEGGEAH